MDNERLIIRDGIQEPTLRFLQLQLLNVLDSKPVRPWYFAELHNPWSRAAAVVDSWRFLDLCHNEFITDLAGNVIGPDIILYDSQFAPDHTLYRRYFPGNWLSDAGLCPTDPHAGVVARIPIRDGHMSMEFDNTDSGNGIICLPMPIGTIVVHPIGMRYRYYGVALEDGPFEYVIRYFPATSKYLRQQCSNFYKKLNVLAPLQNYADRPLWLVRGEDLADNDFVTGFKQKAGHWTRAAW